MSRSWAGGSTRAHRKARALILQRDGHTCQLQLDGCTTIATEAHHTLGKSITGNDPRFMVAACRNCNNKTGDPRPNDPKPKPRTQW